MIPLYLSSFFLLYYFLENCILDFFSLLLLHPKIIRMQKSRKNKPPKTLESKTVLYTIPLVKGKRKKLRKTTWFNVLKKHEDLIPEFYSTTYSKHPQAGTLCFRNAKISFLLTLNYCFLSFLLFFQLHSPEIRWCFGYFQFSNSNAFLKLLLIKPPLTAWELKIKLNSAHCHCKI